MTREVSNSEDIIDSRDIIRRIRELESDMDTAHSEAMVEAGAEEDEFPSLDEWLKQEADDYKRSNQAEAAELIALRALEEEAEAYSADWRHGATLIRDSYWAEYAQELVNETESLNAPDYVVIDWEATAENLKADYTSVDFDGVEYWIR